MQRLYILLHRMGGVVAVTVFVSITGICGLFGYVFTQFDDEGMFPAQDCMGTTLWITGTVTDDQGDLIPGATITAQYDGTRGQSAYTLHAITDNDGHFTTDSVFTFGCIAFELTISAEGYLTQAHTYYPPAMGLSDEVPNPFVVQLQSNAQ